MAKQIGNMQNTGSKMEASINALAGAGLGNLNIDASKYKPDTEGYKSEMGAVWDKYAGMSANQLNSIKEQTALRQQQLQNELNINKQKYQIEHDRNVGMVNQQHKQANDEVAQNRYDNLDYSNQMGAMRGMSNSAQQTAMDNGVYRHATKLFNDNTNTRNQALNDLSYRLQSLNLELDMGYSKNMTDLAISQMQQQSQVEQQMAGQYLQHATATTNQVFSMLDKYNDRLFQTDMQKAQTQQQVNMFLAQLYAEDAKMADAFSRDLQKMATQHSYNKDMASFQHGLSMQMAEYQNKLAMARDASNRSASASASTSDSNAKAMQDYEAMLIDQYINKDGLSFQEAQKKAQNATAIYFDTGRTLSENAQYAGQVFGNMLNNPLKQNGATQNYFDSSKQDNTMKAIGRKTTGKTLSQAGEDGEMWKFLSNRINEVQDTRSQSKLGELASKRGR